MNEKEFAAGWIARLSDGELKAFPGDFIKTENVREFELPAKSVVIGNEFFGSYEIITTDGQSIIHADSYLLAKYYVYSNRNKDRKISIPNEEKEINNTVLAYEEYLDGIIKKIEKSYSAEFPESKFADAVINDVFRALNINRY